MNAQYQVIDSQGKPATADADTLARWVRMGKITPDTPITDLNTGQSVRADQLPFLSSSFATQPKRSRNPLAPLALFLGIACAFILGIFVLKAVAPPAPQEEPRGASLSSSTAPRPLATPAATASPAPPAPTTPPAPTATFRGGGIAADRLKAVTEVFAQQGIQVEQDPSEKTTVRVHLPTSIATEITPAEAKEMATIARDRLSIDAVVYIMSPSGQTLAKATPSGVE